MCTGKHLVGDHAERIQIICRVRRAVLCPRIGRIGFRVRAQCERVEHVERFIAVRHGVHEPEAHDLRRAILAHEHGMGAQVAVNDPVAMRVCEAARDAFDDGPRLFVLEAFAADFADEPAQPAPTQRLHHDEHLVLVLIDVVDRDDVRMNEGLRAPHGRFEGGIRERLMAQVHGDDLHRDVKIALLRFLEIDRIEHLSDAAKTERCDDAVAVLQYGSERNRFERAQRLGRRGGRRLCVRLKPDGAAIAFEACRRRPHDGRWTRDRSKELGAKLLEVRDRRRRSLLAFGPGREWRGTESRHDGRGVEPHRLLGLEVFERIEERAGGRSRKPPLNHLGFDALTPETGSHRIVLRFRGDGLTGGLEREAPFAQSHDDVVQLYRHARLALSGLVIVVSATTATPVGSSGLVPRGAQKPRVSTCRFVVMYAKNRAAYEREM